MNLYVALPGDAPVERLGDIERAGWSDRWSAQDLLVQWLVDVLHRPNHVCIFEHFYMRTSHEPASTLKTRTRYHGEDIYHLLLDGDDGEYIRKTVEEVETPHHLLGAVFELQNPNWNHELEGNAKLEQSLIDALSKKVIAIICDAYDNDGYALALPGMVLP